MTAVCPDCGRSGEPLDRFCGACGAKLGEQSHDEPTDAFDPVEELPHGDDRERFPTECGLFVVESGPMAGSRYGLEAVVTSVGRHGKAGILLDDVTVSRRHAVVERIGDRYVASDVGSLNGTWLNGKRIDSAELNDGDELQVGRFKLMFFHGTAG
ncbi:MAG: FHA domain-containing protein [Acidimicrobiales bacterium]|nr:FHA domain-containing protein [Acidimicrobiales bacterium]